MTCATCECPLQGNSARLLVAESPTKPGNWGALRCPQCGHMASMFEGAKDLEFAPQEDARWVPLNRSPAAEFKQRNEPAGARAWILGAIARGKRWTAKIRADQEVTDEAE